MGGVLRLRCHLVVEILNFEPFVTRVTDLDATVNKNDFCKSMIYGHDHLIQHDFISLSSRVHDTNDPNVQQWPHSLKIKFSWRETSHKKCEIKPGFNLFIRI